MSITSKPAADAIANGVVSTLKSQGIKVSDSFAAQLPCVVSVLMTLTQSTRNALSNILHAYLVQLQIIKQAILAQAQLQESKILKYNTVIGAINEILAPIEQLMQIVPIDGIAGDLRSMECKSFFLNSLFDSISIQMPPAVAKTLQALGLEQEFDFSGVTSYREFKTQLEDIVFKVQKLTSVNNLIKNQNSWVDDKIATISAYIEAIKTLELPS